MRSPHYVDTGTVWKSASSHEPILWRHVSWSRQSPDREVKEQSPWGWIFYRRVKTGKAFYRPMNRVVHAHIKSIMPENPRPDDAVFHGGGSRPNSLFQAICDLAGVKPKTNAETGHKELWVLKDLRNTCATYYDEHVPESSVEILGHALAGITYRHYAHRGPLAFKAIMTLPQPSAFSALVKGYDRECPLLPKAVCRRVIESQDASTRSSRLRRAQFLNACFERASRLARARRSTHGAGTDARKPDPLRDTGGGDRRSERKRNHQRPTSVRRTAAVVDSNPANEVPTDLGNQNRDTP